jgi:hypothetical protein
MSAPANTVEEKLRDSSMVADDRVVGICKDCDDCAGDFVSLLSSVLAFASVVDTAEEVGSGLDGEPATIRPFSALDRVFDPELEELLGDLLKVQRLRVVTRDREPSCLAMIKGSGW